MKFHFLVAERCRIKDELGCMVSIAVLCRHCGSDQVVHNGHAANGKQMYKCRSCGRNSRESSQHEKYTPEQKETILCPTLSD